MALKAILTADEHKALAEPLQKEYAQKDGRYMLDVEPVDDVALENVKGLKTALSKERTAREGLEKTMKAFEGLDAEKARSALQKIEEMADWKPEDKVKEQIESIKNQLTDKYKKEIEKLEGRKGHLAKKIEQLLIDAKAVQALSEEKGNAKLLLPHIRSVCRVEETQDGDFVARVLDDHGNIRLTEAGGSHDPMEIPELVKLMKKMDTYAPAFAGTGASGSGARGSFGAGGSGVYRLSVEEARDPAKYRAAKEAAEKAGADIREYMPKMNEQ